MTKPANPNLIFPNKASKVESIILSLSANAFTAFPQSNEKTGNAPPIIIAQITPKNKKIISFFSAYS